MGLLRKWEIPRYRVKVVDRGSLTRKRKSSQFSPGNVRLTHVFALLLVWAMEKGLLLLIVYRSACRD